MTCAATALGASASHAPVDRRPVSLSAACGEEEAASRYRCCVVGCQADNLGGFKAPARRPAGLPSCAGRAVGDGNVTSIRRGNRTDGGRGAGDVGCSDESFLVLRILEQSLKFIPATC